MPTTIFVSYPSADLERSTRFYLALGAELDTRFSDDNSACFKWDENIFLMLLRREFFQSFTEKQIADPKVTAQVQSAFFVSSREEVDRIAEAGLAAGGSEAGEAQDFGFTYSRDLEDPDGNIIAFMYMVPAAIEQGPQAYLAAQPQA